MPEVLESTPQTTETVVTETPTLQSQQDLNRQALYNQYYGTSTGGTESVVEATPVVDTTAQVVQEPVVQPPAATLPPEYLQVLQAMQAELAALRAAQPVAVSTAPAAPAEIEPAWIPLLREGKIKEAEDAMAQSVMARIKDQFGNQFLQQSTAQTREIMRAEAETDRFTSDLRAQNPELVPMEKMIAVHAQELMNVARQQGKIHTTDDAIRTYKESVTEAVSSARKLYHTLRGDGKQEAQVRQREVLSSRPIPPQSVDTSRPQVNGQDAQEPPVESGAEYLQKRLAVQNWQKGLAPKPNFL